MGNDPRARARPSAVRAPPAPRHCQPRPARARCVYRKMPRRRAETRCSRSRASMRHAPELKAGRPGHWVACQDRRRLDIVRQRKRHDESCHLGNPLHVEDDVRTICRVERQPDQRRGGIDIRCGIKGAIGQCHLRRAGFDQVDPPVTAPHPPTLRAGSSLPPQPRGEGWGEGPSPADHCFSRFKR
jgi:hypothetical protein